MPVIQCPSCQKSLNVKQMPPGGKIKCPGCGNAISVGGAGAARPTGTAAKPRPAGGRPLTPEDEGFDFAQIQFPSAGPVAVSRFPSDPDSRSVYQGPVPGDPLGASADGADPESVTEGKTKKKSKGQLSPKTIAGILAGVFAFLLAAITVGTLMSGSGDEDSKDQSSGSSETTAEGG